MNHPRIWLAAMLLMLACVAGVAMLRMVAG